MGNDFEVALAFTFKREGDLSDDEDDHGGLTYKGITQTLYTAYRLGRNLGIQPVVNASEVELHDCAYAMVWMPGRCAFFRSPLSIIHFDNTFIMGIHHAAMLLQGVLGVKTDGEIGVATIAEADRRPEKILAHDLVSARRGYHIKAVIDEPSQDKFLAGWLNRCSKLDRFIFDSFDKPIQARTA